VELIGGLPLANGSHVDGDQVDEVRREVEDNLRILGAGGGYILAPCHNVQALTPIENVLAMYEAAYELGWT
jgi:uroporphyrinogen decarboxylase